MTFNTDLTIKGQGPNLDASLPPPRNEKSSLGGVIRDFTIGGIGLEAAPAVMTKLILTVLASYTGKILFGLILAHPWVWPVVLITAPGVGFYFAYQQHKKIEERMTEWIEKESLIKDLTLEKTQDELDQTEKLLNQAIRLGKEGIENQRELIDENEKLKKELEITKKMLNESLTILDGLTEEIEGDERALEQKRKKNEPKIPALLESWSHSLARIATSHQPSPMKKNAVSSSTASSISPTLAPKRPLPPPPKGKKVGVQRRALSHFYRVVTSTKSQTTKN